MFNFKIPFGWDPIKQQWKEANKVSSGLSCGCICHACKGTLQAVHRKVAYRSYFRHHSLVKCSGALESLAHKLAKDVLEQNSSVMLPTGKMFHYDRCLVENRIHGKKPDIYVTDSRSGKTVVVEIFYTHKIEQSTLKAFKDMGEPVMEIDISSLKRGLPSMEEFEDLILEKAPRTFLTVPVAAVRETAIPSPIDYNTTELSTSQRVHDWLSENWPIVLAALAGVIIYFVTKRRRRRYVW